MTATPTMSARFENHDELDLEGPDNEHVGFSQGIDYCFGAPPARLEVRMNSLPDTRSPIG
jgi:cytochrome P450